MVVVWMMYECDGVCFICEVFVSKLGEVIVLCFMVDKFGVIFIMFVFMCLENVIIVFFGVDGLCMSGQLLDGFGGKVGVKFVVQLKVFVKGGSVKVNGDMFVVIGVDEFMVIFIVVIDIKIFVGCCIDNVVEVVEVDFVWIVGQLFDVFCFVYVVDY